MRTKITITWLECDWITEKSLNKTWNLSKVALVYEMKQNLLMKMNLWQWSQFTLFPLKIYLHNHISRWSASTQRLIRHVPSWRSVQLVQEWTKCGFVLCGSLLCCSSRFVGSKSSAILSLFWHGAQCVQVWPDSNAKAFAHDAAEVKSPVKAVCSCLLSAWLQSFPVSSEGTLFRQLLSITFGKGHLRSEQENDGSGFFQWPLKLFAFLFRGV